MKNYLVTGGSGFIGANLIKTLVEQHKKVFVLVEKNANLWRIKNLLNSVRIHEDDITNEHSINKFIQTINPDIIFHLAAQGVNPNNKTNIKQLFNVNLHGTINLLDACKKTGFQCFINTGSASEYGEKKEALNENMNLEPIDDYSVSKAATTTYCLKEAHVNRLPIYTIRPFCVYGDLEPPHRLIPSIMINAILNKPIKLSSPHFVRDFIYVKDIADFYISLSKQCPENNAIFNIGTGIQSSIKNTVNIIQTTCHTKIDIQWNTGTARPWEFKNWQADINLAKNVLNWYPKYKLEEGLKNTFDWFKKNINLYTQNENKRNSATNINKFKTQILGSNSK